MSFRFLSSINDLIKDYSLSEIYKLKEEHKLDEYVSGYDKFRIPNLFAVVFRNPFSPLTLDEWFEEEEIAEMTKYIK